MNFTEPPEHALLRESVGKIAAGYGHAYYLSKARADERPSELWEELGRNGFIGVNIPEEHGGGGMGIAELNVICEELGIHGCPLLLLIVAPAICGSIIAKHGAPEQKSAWLPRIASGEMKMAFAITEPDAGSNTHRISTVAERVDGRWHLRGTKYYISGVDESEAVLVVARTGTEAETGKARLSLFIVDTDAPGLGKDIIPVEITSPDKQYTLFFDDVVVGDDRLVGTEGEGLHQVFSGLNPERITGAATALGIGLYALDKASAYGRERRVWDVPIGSHQGVSHPLAEAKIEVELARLMTQKAAWLYDAGLDAAEAANIAKFAAAEAGFRALDRAVQTHGGNGLATEFGLATMWGLSRLLRIAPVSREMILNYVAHHSLGLPKSY